MKKKNFSILLISSLLLFSFITTAYANKSLSEVVYEDNCLDGSTRIRFFNETNYTPIISEYSYDEMENNDSIVFQPLDGDINIYDGPFDSSQNIFNKTFSDTNEIIFTFPKQSTYLVKIDFEQEISPYEERYFHEPSCKNAIEDEPPKEEEQEVIEDEDSSTISQENLIQNQTTQKDSLQEEDEQTKAEETSKEAPQEERAIEEYEIETKESSKLTTYIGAGIVAVILLFVLIYAISKKTHEKKINSANNKNANQKAASNDEHVTTLTNYNDTLEHVKSYLREYKDKYTKDQLYRALEHANIPRDIINKAINDIY